MSRAKRKSSILETALRRLAGLKTISPLQQLGSDLTVEAYEAEISAVSTELAGYNQEVVELDNRQDHFELLEESLRDKNGRILRSIEAVYGPDSPEYAAVGGTRTSERKRPTRKSASKGSPIT